MEIIFALMVLGATPFGAALLADKPTRKRVERFVDIHWLKPLEEKVKPASLAPSIIPSGYGKLEPKEKNSEAQKKLAELWQDAFDWFAIENVAEVLKIAKLIEAERKEFVAAEREALEMIQYRKKDSGNYYGYFEMEYRAKVRFEDAQDEAIKMFPLTSEQKKALALSKKYGWELIDNGIIRNVEKGRPLAVDPIVYAL